MEPFDDTAIVHQVRAGDRNSYKQLIRKYQDPVYTLMLRFTGSQLAAQDLVQETFMRAYANLERFDTKKRFFPWLYTIGMNIARDWGRKNKDIQHIPFSEEIDAKEYGAVSPFPGQQHDLERKEQISAVQGALTEIGSEYSEAVILRYRYDMSMQEISEVLGLSLSGAKMRVHRGLKKLQQVVSQEKV